MKALENFRRNLRTAMDFRGMSQRALAEKVDTGHSYVNRVLMGRTAPSVVQAEEFSRALGFTLIDLLAEPRKFSQEVLTSVA